MTKKKNLRIATRHKEIFQVIAESQKSEVGNFIWKTVENRRKTYPVKINALDAEANRIYVQLLQPNPSFKVGDHIYLKLNVRDSAFKAEILEKSYSGLTLNFPEEVAINENRNFHRDYFHPSDEKFVQVKRVKNLVSSLKDKVHDLKVFDISESGLSVFLPLSLGHYYNVQTGLVLESIGPYHLPKAIVGQVVFKMTTEVKGTLSSEEGFKIGIQLDSKIPKETLSRFVLKKIFSITDEQVVQDEAFRRKVTSKMKVVNKQLASKKLFREFFASLEVQRSDNQYLNQHIHLLCQVLIGLGSKLGWISEKTQEKLIYVAYLHDIRLMKYPHLARIKTKKQFDTISKTLSEAERKAFLEAPAYSAEIARQDNESYPDAIKILLQQKELPDGSGFPQGTVASGLAPLSCLFILSHFFVDYVMDHADWTTADFVKSYRSQLKGAYFQKIFQIMS